MNPGTRTCRFITANEETGVGGSRSGRDGEEGGTAGEGENRDGPRAMRGPSLARSERVELPTA